MEVKDKKKEGLRSKGGKEEVAEKEKVEGRRMSEEEVFRRVLNSINSGKEDKEAFEELKRINKKERNKIGEEVADKFGRELLEECKKEVGVSIEKIIELILKGANLNFKDKDGNTALWWVSSHKHKNIKIALLNSGATVMWVRK